MPQRCHYKKYRLYLYVSYKNGIRTISWIMVPITYLSNPYGHKNKSFYSKAREGILGSYNWNTLQYLLRIILPVYFYYAIGVRFLQALSIVWCPMFYLIIGNMLNGLIQYILILYYIWVSKEQPFVPSSVIIYSQLSHVHNVTRHT